MTKKKCKRLDFISNDLEVNRGMVVKIKTVNIEQPNVLELNFSCIAIPKKTEDSQIYDESISRIKRVCNRICGSYVRSLPSLLSDKYIYDINFTTANLKKGYNKSVSISVYIKQKRDLKFTIIKNKIKQTIKPMVRDITDTIRNENFSCYKHKKVKQKNKLTE